MNDIRDHLLTRSINISCTHRSLPRLVTRTAPSDVDFRQSTRDDDDIDDDSPTEMPTRFQEPRATMSTDYLQNEATAYCLHQSAPAAILDIVKLPVRP
jgi:hypothetical protein